MMVSFFHTVLVACAVSGYVLSPSWGRSRLGPRLGQPAMRAEAAEDDEGPIRWLTLNPKRPDREPSEVEGTMVLPLFPLGSIA